MGWIVSPLATPSSNAQVLTHTTSIFDLIWRLGLYRGKPVKVSSFGWLLTQYDQCPIKKGKSGHRHAWQKIVWRDTGRRRPPHAKERDLVQILSLQPLEKTIPADTFVSDFQPPELWGNMSLWFKPRCYGSPSWRRKCARHITRLSSINLPTHPVRQKLYPPTWQTRKLKHRAGKYSVWNHTVRKRPSSTLNSRRPEQCRAQKAWFLHSFETLIRSQARLTIIQLFFILNTKKISCT